MKGTRMNRYVQASAIPGAPVAGPLPTPNAIQGNGALHVADRVLLPE